MSNVSANIGANTQQAESSIGRLLASYASCARKAPPAWA